MTITMAEAMSRRNATAMQDRNRGLHDYGSIGEAQVALQNSRIHHATLDNARRTAMAQWMWRNDASPEDAAIAFGLRLPGESGLKGQGDPPGTDQLSIRGRNEAQGGGSPIFSRRVSMNRRTRGGT